MGRKDYVPMVLTELGVQTVFHRVDLRPGKPIWFGVFAGADRQTLVFGLPGNPVSSFVCFYLFVKPTVDALQGSTSPFRHGTAHLASNVTISGNRPTYFPARYIGDRDELELLAWKGSADQRTLCEADCLAFFPQAGDYVSSTAVLTLPLT
jgi:molybdopterin molybdotransferase